MCNNSFYVNSAEIAIMRRMHSEGHTVVYISHILRRSQPTIAKWLNRNHVPGKIGRPFGSVGKPKTVKVLSNVVPLEDFKRLAATLANVAEAANDIIASVSA
jgi:hypothetical protein